MGRGTTSEDHRQMAGGDIRVVSNPIVDMKGTPNKVLDPQVEVIQELKVSMCVISNILPQVVLSSSEVAAITQF